MLEKTYSSLLLIAFLPTGACGLDRSIASNESLGGTGPFTTSGGAEIDAPADALVCAYGQILCDGHVAKVCDGKGSFTKATDCATECKDGLGCVMCVPKEVSCVLNRATVCDATGSRQVSFICGGDDKPGMTCKPDGCAGPCSPTSLGMGYQGCEFWPTVTANAVWSDRTHSSAKGGFHFGVLLGNVSTTTAANVTVSRAGKSESVTILPGAVLSKPLDWVLELKGADWEMPFLPAGPVQSVNKLDGAYHVVSDQPIVAYQFNALEGKLDGAEGCPMLPGNAGEGGCYAYSNDASLLIPAHALAADYVASGYHSWHEDPFPRGESGKLNMGDFIAITATETDTEVTIALRPKQGILAFADLPRVAAGQSTTLSMSPGQVIQIFAPGTSTSDTLSGTEISARDAKTHEQPKPIQIVSGVSCASVAEDATPCGHVEDIVLPAETLGRDYVVPVPHSAAGKPVAHTIRVQSISDETALTFEPTTLTGVTLGRGEVIDLPNVMVDVRISSTVPFGVTQYLNGRGDLAKPVADGQNFGGPNQATVPPSAQFRTAYPFIASPHFEVNFVSIVAPTGTAVTLDEVPIPQDAFTAIGSSGMSVARRKLAHNDRVHFVSAAKPVGISVYGYSPFSSYLYSGGLDLKRDTPVVAR
ncbi:MAG TPA: IgGFc-binding protein [Polyangiaceae bacterium]|nr:IgGFc-binding protein [Polyangiaceae bacterium]